MYRVRLVSFLPLVLACIQAHAAPSALSSRQIAIVKAAKANQPASIPAPRNLFHWSTRGAAEHFTASMAADGVFPLKTTKRSYFAMLHPEHDDRPGLFAWSHPAAGLGFSSSEIYGGAEALTWLKIRPKAKAVVVVSKEDGSPRSPLSLHGVDLVLHVTKIERDDGTVTPTLMEWIVLDPSAIARATSDRAVLSRKLTPWIERMRRPGFQLERWDRHSSGGFFDGERLPHTVVPLLERYVSGAKDR